MSTIIKFIITYVLSFLACLAVGLPIAYIEIRKMDKHVSESIRKLRENRAALDKSQDESRAQVDEIGESADEIHKDIGEIHEDMDEIDESLDKMDKSMDRLVEFTRLMRDYSNYKIKMIEARENFREPEFSDEKNID